MKSVRKGISAALAGLMVFLAVFTYNMSEAQAAGGIEITEAAGYAEGAYAEFTTGLSAKGYNAYVKKSSQADSAYVKLDNELIRVYPDYIRVDAVGLEAGDYVIKIVPVYGGTEKPSEAAATAALSAACTAMTEPALHGLMVRHQVHIMRTELLRVMPL